MEVWEMEKLREFLKSTLIGGFPVIFLLGICAFVLAWLWNLPQSADRKRTRALLVRAQ